MSAVASTSLPASPSVALTHETRLAPSTTEPLDPMDSFFGYTFSSNGTQESRHDRRDSTIVEPLPAYTAEDSSLPEYTLHAPEPVTLAMYLFKFGFLFPPFWIFGAFILFSDLREPPSSLSTDSDIEGTPAAWMPEKTEDERKAIIATLRSTELKWAKRCLVALVILLALALAAGLGSWAILRRA